MKRVVLDPGHGGTDRKNIGPTGYVEADGVLDIALHCREELLTKGFRVIMTRETDKTLSIRQRADIINAAGADVAVSIHTNAAGPQVRGIETIYSIHGTRGKKLARVIYERLHKDLGIPQRRTFCRESESSPGKDYYGIIRQTVCPCVIVEVEFHSNMVGEILLKDSRFRKEAGKSIARGIKEYFEGR